MKKCISLFLFAILLVSCQRTMVERKLNELDAVISQRHVYTEGLEREIKLFKDTLAMCQDDSVRWEYLHNIESRYETFDLDSAWYYAREMRRVPGKTKRQQFDSQIASILIDARLDDMNSAQFRLQSINPDSLDVEEQGLYHKMKAYYYYKMRDRSILESDIVRYNELAKQEDEQTAERGAQDMFFNVRREVEALDKQDPEAGVKYLIEIYGQESKLRTKSGLAYDISKEYKKLNNNPQYQYWLAQASIDALKTPFRTYFCLDELAMELYYDGDFRRAANYMDVVMDDALEANFLNKIVTSAKASLLIDSKNDYREKINKILTWSIICLISVLLVVVCVSLVGSKKKSSLLQKSYGKISELSKIKEGYVFNYMKLSVDYLGKVENYRHELRVALKDGGPEAVASMLRRPSRIREDYNKFYKVFDETFLNIFPDFIPKVNELLVPSAAFELDENGAMPTGLRILAAIRLGFETSGQIAQFLDCAPSSVYTHRSKIKAKALIDPEIFEERIKNIS